MEIAEIELKGHIIDSDILNKVFDTIIDLNGDFDVKEFKIGKHKKDPSYARILIMAETKEVLEDILTAVHDLGAVVPEIYDAVWEEAIGDKIVPGGFYTTTNHPTFVRINKQWVAVENIGMDCLIIIEGDRAICKPIDEIKRRDRVLVGRTGIKVVPPPRPREKNPFFGFMTNQVSSERPNLSSAKKIAQEIIKIKKDKGGKITIVGGPAIVHTGASDSLAWMIENGFVDLLLAGNALAVHDIEKNLYGTSLGMDIATGEPTIGGNKNHIYTISEIIKAGSIKNAVEKGILKKGIFYECIVKDIPFILAGSIRDDGPLPDTITDTMVAKKMMREKLKYSDMVIMISTMLHSIAVGNMLPSFVETVIIDINPLAITKLVDRGSAQAVGIVADIGSFLPLLVSELKELTDGSVREG